jgi:hypothetical protein
MNTLSEEQAQRIKEIFSSDEEWAIINDLVSPEERSVISEGVKDGLRRHGAPIDYGPSEEGIWGGRVAMDIKRYLADTAKKRLEQYRAQICGAVCVQFQYCKRRREKQFETEGVMLALAVADSILAVLTPFPLPVTSVSVYLVKTRLLDQWCQCDTSPEK